MGLTVENSKDRKPSRSARLTKNALRIGGTLAVLFGTSGDARAPQIDHPDIDPVGTTHVLKKPLNLRGWRNSLPGVTATEEEGQSQRQRTRTEAVANQHVANLPQAARPDTLQMTYEDQEKGKTFATVLNIIAGMVGTGVTLFILDQIRRNPKKGMVLLAGALAACGPMVATAQPTESAPTVIVQSTKAPETATPFVNENITATPNPTENAAPQTNEYPTSFGGGEAAGMYTYEGQAGREAMTPVLRGYNDRYIPEMKRAGFITGETPAEQYTSFDNSGYEMRYFESKTGQWVLMPYHPSHGYFVPTNVDGLPYVDLKLPYGEVFAPDGSPVNQGNDNFNFQTFQADGVQFINGWPILIRTDGEGLASTALDMKKGGAETPIVLASATEAALMFSLDSAGLEAEQLAAMKAHPGLEGSITAVEGGKYTVSASVYNNEGLPGALAMEVLPATMHENIDLKNDLGNTPVMQTADGKTLYWIQEKGGWYELELSADINNPVKIPFEDRIVATRIVIAHFNEPFSQQALDQWKTSPGISLLLEYVDTSGKKIAYLSSKSMIGDGITMEERTVIPLDVWFESSIPDNGSPTGATAYRYYYSKWLNPVDNNNPNGNEWMVIPHASGPEIMNDDTNRAKLDNLLNLVENGEPVNASVPIFIFDPGFFDTTGNFITLSVPQPSLEKLKNQPGNNPSALGFISDVNNQAINGGWGPNNVLMEWLYGQRIPSDIQTMLIPTLVVHR